MLSSAIACFKSPENGHYNRKAICESAAAALKSRTMKLSFDIDAVVAGRLRLSDAQALELYHHASIHDLGTWASAVTQRMHPEDHRTYVIDRNINYTNVCTAKCTFCAFR